MEIDITFNVIQVTFIVKNRIDNDTVEYRYQ